MTNLSARAFLAVSAAAGLIALTLAACGRQTNSANNSVQNTSAGNAPPAEFMDRCLSAPLPETGITTIGEGAKVQDLVDAISGPRVTVTWEKSSEGYILRRSHTDQLTKTTEEVSLGLQETKPLAEEQRACGATVVAVVRMAKNGQEFPQSGIYQTLLNVVIPALHAKATTSAGPQPGDLGAAFAVAFGGQHTLKLEQDEVTLTPKQVLKLADGTTVLLTEGVNDNTCQACAGAIIADFLRADSAGYSKIASAKRYVTEGKDGMPPEWKLVEKAAVPTLQSTNTVFDGQCTETNVETVTLSSAGASKPQTSRSSKCDR